jgi:hypothetical protein
MASEALVVPVGHGDLGTHRDQRSGHGRAGDSGAGYQYPPAGKLHH